MTITENLFLVRSARPTMSSHETGFSVDSQAHDSIHCAVEWRTMIDMLVGSGRFYELRVRKFGLRKWDYQVPQAKHI